MVVRDIQTRAIAPHNQGSFWRPVQTEKQRASTIYIIFGVLLECVLNTNEKQKSMVFFLLSWCSPGSLILMLESLSQPLGSTKIWPGWSVHGHALLGKSPDSQHFSTPRSPVGLASEELWALRRLIWPDDDPGGRGGTPPAHNGI